MKVQKIILLLTCSQIGCFSSFFSILSVIRIAKYFGSLKTPILFQRFGSSLTLTLHVFFASSDIHFSSLKWVTETLHPFYQILNVIVAHHEKRFPQPWSIKNKSQCIKHHSVIYSTFLSKHGLHGWWYDGESSYVCR